MADEKEKKQQPEFPTSYGDSNREQQANLNNQNPIVLEYVLQIVAWGIAVLGFIGSVILGDAFRILNDYEFNTNIFLSGVLATGIQFAILYAIADIVKRVRHTEEVQEKILEALNKQSSEE